MSPFCKVAILVSTIVLTACHEAPEPAAAPAMESAKPVAAPVETPAPAAGGYVPNDSERVPGITLSQEELDKLYAEARAATPQPVIPASEK